MNNPGATKGRLVVITGPAGVGKSSIVRRVLEQTGAAYSVSVTTRPPRPGEVEGRDYIFVDRPTFEKMRDGGELLEWAEVFGQCYGTPAGPVRKAVSAGKTIVLDIDVQGGLQVHRQMPEATFVLVLPPNFDELKRRLTARGTETPDAAQRRFTKARAEIDQARQSGVYTYTVVNDSLGEAVRQVAEIVYQEHTKND